MLLYEQMKNFTNKNKCSEKISKNKIKFKL